MKDNALREDGLPRRTPRLPDPGKTLLVDIPPIDVRMTQLGPSAVETVRILPRHFDTAASSESSDEFRLNSHIVAMTSYTIVQQVR
jgi:hypothetical protein